MANEHEWDEEDYFSNPTLEDVMGEMISNVEYQWEATYEIIYTSENRVIAEVIIQDKKYTLTLALNKED
jgi:hypothetical protein